MAGHKRRGSGKRRKPEDGGGSESDGEGDSAEPSGDPEPSASPEVPSLPHSRRNSSSTTANATAANSMDVTLPPLHVNGAYGVNGSGVHRDHREEGSKLPSIIQSSMMQGPQPPSQQQQQQQQQERAFVKHELPPIATLPPVPSAQDHMMPMRTAMDMQAPGPQRRRTSSAASSKGRQNGFSSKIVACNFCRGAFSSSIFCCVYIKADLF